MGQNGLKLAFFGQKKTFVADFFETGEKLFVPGSEKILRFKFENWLHFP